MTSQRNKIREDVRFRIMRILHENPEISQRELASAVGISVGSAHYVISAMLETGLIKISNFSQSDNKRRYAYLLTPKGLAEKAVTTKRFLERKLAEYEALRDEIAALQQEVGDPPSMRNAPGA